MQPITGDPRRQKCRKEDEAQGRGTGSIPAPPPWQGEQEFRESLHSAPSSVKGLGIPCCPEHSLGSTECQDHGAGKDSRIMEPSLWVIPTSHHIRVLSTMPSCPLDTSNLEQQPLPMASPPLPERNSSTAGQCPGKAPPAGYNHTPVQSLFSI